MNRTLKAFSMTALMALLVAACAPVATSTPETVVVTVTPSEYEPIKVGLSAVFTGPVAFIGEGYNWGMTMAIEDLGGQIAGRPIQLVTADNKCNPTDAVTAVRHLIEIEQVDVILGSGCSGATLGSLPIILEGETPQLTVASTNPGIYEQLGVGGNPWGFRLNIDDQIMAQTYAPYIAENNRTVFTIAENTDFGRGAIERYLVELPTAGAEVIGSEFFDLGTADFRPALTAIKALNPDAILIVMTERDGSTFMRQLREVGVGANIFSRGSLTSPLFLEFTKDDPTIGEGIIEASFWALGIDPEAEARFQKRWGSPASPHRMLAYYGMYYILADAIERAIAKTGEATRQSIRDALETASVDTPLGHIEFDDHHQGYPNMTLSTIRDGKVVLLDVLPVVRR